MEAACGEMDIQGQVHFGRPKHLKASATQNIWSLDTGENADNNN